MTEHASKLVPFCNGPCDLGARPEADMARKIIAPAVIGYSRERSRQKEGRSLQIKEPEPAEVHIQSAVQQPCSVASDQGVAYTGSREVHQRPVNGVER